MSAKPCNLSNLASSLLSCMPIIPAWPLAFAISTFNSPAAANLALLTSCFSISAAMPCLDFKAAWAKAVAPPAPDFLIASKVLANAKSVCSAFISAALVATWRSLYGFSILAYGLTKRCLPFSKSLISFK